MDELIEGFLDELRRDSALSDERIEVLRALLVRFVELAMVDNDLGDLRVAVQALNELTEASTLFSSGATSPNWPSSGRRARRSRTPSTRWPVNSGRPWPNAVG